MDEKVKHLRTRVVRYCSFSSVSIGGVRCVKPRWEAQSYNPVTQVSVTVDHDAVSH